MAEEQQQQKIPTVKTPTTSEESPADKNVPSNAFDVIGNLDRVLPDIAQDVFKNTGGSNISAERHYLLKKRQQLFSDSSIAIGENSRYGSDAYKDFETFDDIARRTYIKNLKLVQASHRDDVQNDTYGFFRDNFLATTASLQHIPMDAMFPDTHGKYWLSLLHI